MGIRLDQYSLKDLKNSMRAAASLDEMICKEEWLRCFEYNASWQHGVEMAKYSNGGGDHFFIFFWNDSAILKGFDHESEVSPYAQEEITIWPGVYQDVPTDLFKLIKDESVEPEDVTFCFWRLNGDSSWKQGTVKYTNNEDDGSDWLLNVIPFTPEEYIVYASDYFEDDFNLSKNVIVGMYSAQ